jgi:methionyl-tRNA formyltransferase
VDTLREGLGPATPQAGEPTYAAKVTPEDLRLDWSRRADELGRIVRVGGAWTTFRGHRLKVLAAVPTDGTGTAPGVIDGDRVGTGDGVLTLRTVQPEGKAPMPVAAWRNGARPLPGETLGP